MMRKRSVKSFTQKKAGQTTLPPLQRHKTQVNETQNQDQCVIRPAAFIIRKKTTSFIEATRKTEGCHQFQQNLKYNIPPPKTMNSGLKSKRKEDKIIQLAQLPFKNQDLNEHVDFSLDKVELGQSYYVDNSFCKKSFNENQSANDMLSGKSLAKKSKQRKIQQCKMRKIPWGQKNTAFDLAISAIKQNKLGNHEAPLESLQDLYSQMI